MDFEALLNRLCELLRLLVHNGAMTERGLARRVGLSQPHIHNVLQGRRILTSQTADLIMSALQISVWDLAEDAEHAAEERRGRRIE